MSLSTDLLGVGIPTTDQRSRHDAFADIYLTSTTMRWYLVSGGEPASVTSQMIWPKLLISTHLQSGLTEHVNLFGNENR